jgi:peptidoglycan/xylan/chitin deacetylase (PgdA/CDA1 family)
VLSHDTDAITLGSPSEMAFNLVKGVVRGDRTSLSMFGQGFRYLRRPTENPLFGFPGWRNLEAPKFRSCFYLFAKPKNLKRHLNDCRSTVVEQKIDWAPLREMAASGWEFGLHAPIYAKRQAAALRWGKQFIEDKIGQPVQGLRHHYWALDWRNPYLTFRKHIEAGFGYDSSIAWRDGMGFRAGTSMPFQPFDPEPQTAMPIYELPTSLMDGHLMDGAAMNGDSMNADSGHGGPSRRSAAFQLLREIKARRGMAMLNWHTETACNRYRYQGYVDALGEILEQVASDSEAWITTPGEVVQWWSERQRQLNAQ